MQAGRIGRVWSRELREREIKESSEMSALVGWVDGTKLIIVFVRPLSIFCAWHRTGLSIYSLELNCCKL